MDTQTQQVLDHFKGVDLALTLAVLAFVAEAVQTVAEVHQADGELFVDQTETLRRLVRDKGWTAVQDRWGMKAYKAMPYADMPGMQELRVTVVIPNATRQLRLDIRPWGQYPNRRNG